MEDNLLPESVNCRLAFRDDAQDGSSVLVSVDYAQIEMRLLVRAAKQSSPLFNVRGNPCGRTACPVVMIPNARV